MSHFSSNVPIYDKNLILIIFPFCLGKAETKICTVNTCQQTRRCSFEVVSSVSGKFGDPYSTQVPSSSVFEGSLAGTFYYRAPCSFFELCPFFVAGVAFRDILKSEPSSSVTGAGHRTRFHSCGRHGAFCMLLKRCVGKDERCF